MTRAKEMGFMTRPPVCHASQASSPSSRAVPTTAPGWALPGANVATNPELANDFALAGPASEFARARMGDADPAPQIYPLLHHAQRPTSPTLSGNESHADVVATVRDAFDNGYDA